MQSHVFRWLTLSAFLAVSGLAQAQSTGISWTYVEAAYQTTEFDLGVADLDGDGPLFAGSLALGDYMHAFASFQNSALDNLFGVDPGDLGQYEFGIGFHTPVTNPRNDRLYSDRLSAFFNAQYLGLDPDTGSDADGWGLDVGVRMINFTAWEFIGSAGYEKFESADGELTLKARLLFQIIRNLQIQGGVNWNDNRTQWILGLRYNFPNARLF